ncbi:hypothetical protein [Veronia pacifica]|uniref:Uncharacterized protein n=1 Tax=Veronia pacifica TaxID=1080227 RepID=A0A1C3EBM1_9GAMM|nr:hypothetical protein [Veronia pacifica]ODA30646.1 hypothetical protein A8L45_19790 [Veronia pacifica]
MNKKFVIILSLLLVFGIFYLNKNKGEPLQLASCEKYALSDVVETPIYFYVDARIENVDIDSKVKYANEVLRNSCIPLKRVVSGTEVIDVATFKGLSPALTEFVPNTGLLHSELSDRVGKEKLKSHGGDGRYYGLILSSDYKVLHRTWGIAHLNFGNSFFVMSSDASDGTLEHELGHLSWAFHHNTTEMTLQNIILPQHHDHLRPYARGHYCKGANTIMSGAEHARESIPVYSSPDIFRFGQACGVKESADNARHMREFAAWLSEKQKTVPSS